MDDVDRTGGFIVVGVDGSAGSVRAIRWAAEEAELRRCALEVVTAWQQGALGGLRSESDAATVQQKAIREATADLDPRPMISTIVVEGSPDDALVDRAAGADLLVVGSHGVDSIRHSVLGSTSEYCSRMAGCPVVVLPVPLVAASRSVPTAPPRDQ